MRTTVLKHVPDWAVCYLMNGDASSLGYHDKEAVDKWVDGLFKKGFRLVAPIDGSDKEFVPYPAFGLASGTVDYTVEILEKHHEKRKDS